MTLSINEMLLLLKPIYENFYAPPQQYEYYTKILEKMEKNYKRVYPRYFKTYFYTVSSTLIRTYYGMHDKIVMEDLSKIKDKILVENVIRFCKDRFSTISGILPFLTPHFESHSERVYSNAKLIDLALRYGGGNKVLGKNDIKYLILASYLHDSGYFHSLEKKSIPEALCEGYKCKNEHEIHSIKFLKENFSHLLNEEDIDILEYIIKHHRTKNHIEGGGRKALLASLIKIGDKLDAASIRVKNALELFKELDKYISDENIGKMKCDLEEGKSLVDMLKESRIHWLGHILIKDFRIRILVNNELIIEIYLLGKGLFNNILSIRSEEIEKIYERINSMISELEKVIFEINDILEYFYGCKFNNEEPVKKIEIY